MMEKEYLDKLALLRTEKAQLFSPLFDFLEMYRPTDDFKAMRPYFAIGDKKRRMFMESHF